MKRDDFWNWDYFQHELFLAVAKVMLHDGHGSYQFFKLLKKHIDAAETKLENIKDENIKQRWWNYMMGYFGSFCPVFFETIKSNPNSYSIWHHEFPPEWKITSSNSKTRVPKIILHEFVEWAKKRFSEENREYDSDLTEVVTGIFPGAHPVLLPSFLVLLLSSDIKYAVQNKRKFSLINTSITWSGERKSDEDMQRMFEQQNQSQTEETINIIFKYFGNWRLLEVNKNDISKEEFADWDNYSEEQRKIIINRVRVSKLESILSELNSTEIVTLCQESDYNEYQRKNFIELIELLIKKLHG